MGYSTQFPFAFITNFSFSNSNNWVIEQCKPNFSSENPICSKLYLRVTYREIRQEWIGWWVCIFFFFNLPEQCLCENLIRKLVLSSRGNSESFTNKPKILIDYKRRLATSRTLKMLRGNYTIKVSLSMQKLSHCLIISSSCILRQTVFRKHTYLIPPTPPHLPLTLSHCPLLSLEQDNLVPLFLAMG